MSGFLRFKIPEAQTAPKSNENQKITLKPQEIPIGENNPYIKNVSFSFSQVDYKITKVLLTDAEKERFSIPEDVVPSLPDNDKMTISMSGLKVYQEPFGFEFRSTW